MTIEANPGSFALLADGRTVRIRPATPADGDAVRAMHEQMSADNRYFRFFGLGQNVALAEAARVCRAADDDHAALLAWLDGRLVGVASYESTQRPGIAEIAFAVRDDMHGQGVATLLLEHLVSRARQRGLHAFAAETLPDNYAMQRVFADAGLPVERHYADGVVRLDMPLPGADDDRLDAYLDKVAARASRADVASLRPLLQPASIAVIGAGHRRGTVGREILHNIVAGGYQGNVYPVNPHATSMEGLHCRHSVADLPAGVDLAVVAVPAAAVPAVAADCGRSGVRALVVITAGLGSAGADLLAICRRYGMRLVGPNCFGVAVPALRLNATFGAHPPAAGTAGLVVQSGGVGIALLEHMSRLGIGVSSFASVGDKFDVSSNDLLTWWEQDGSSRLAVLYVESFGNPRAFARTARRLGKQLPVLTVISGRSAAGQRAAASHTAAVATPVVTQEALFGQAGIIATHSLGECIEAAALLSCQPCPAGNRVAIVSNAGGAGVLAADACADSGLQVTALGSGTRRKLTRLLPPGAAVANPVDTSAAVGPDTFAGCLREVAADDAVDAVLVIVVPTAIADLTAATLAAGLTKPVALAVLDQADAVRLLPVPAPPLGPADAGEGAGQAAGPGGEAAAVRSVPAYAYPETAAGALARAARYGAWRSRQRAPLPDLPGIDAAGARQLISAFLIAQPAGGWLPGPDAAQLLGCYQIPLVPTKAVRGEAAAIAAAAEYDGRIVLKADAEGIVHKTDAGAVRLDLRQEDVAGAYRELAASFGARLRQVLVQPMLTGTEVLVGVVQEPVFGPLVVFGLGGVATEVLGDHAARLTPLTRADAEDLIHGVHASPLLLGHRGSPPVDTAALADLLLRVSRLADDFAEIAELDLNPVLARPDAVFAVDARIRIAPAVPYDPYLRRLR